MKVTEVEYVKLSDDSSTYKKKKIPFLICAMSTNPYIPGPCNGDSGGPLMKIDVASGKYEVVGIVASHDEFISGNELSWSEAREIHKSFSFCAMDQRKYG